jgi:O-antigen/teichoic acid export membrane protein
VSVAATSIREGGRRNAASAARGVTWVGAGHVVSQLAWLGSLLLVATRVPPVAFGSVSISMVIVQAAWLLVGSGTRGALVVSGTITRGDVRRALRVNALTGLAIGALAAFLSAPILNALAPGGDSLVLQAMTASIALFGLSVVPLALLQREMRFAGHAGANAGAAVLASAIAIAAAYDGLGVWALVLRQVLFQLLLAAFAWAAARSLVPAARPGDPAPRRDPVTWWFFALAAAAFASLNIDNVIVGRFAGVAELGIYSLAFTLAFAPVTQFAWQIGKVLFASAARTEQPDVISVRAARATRFSALLVWPLIPPAIALAPLVLPRVLGPQWHAMTLPFELLLIVGAVHAVLAVLREFLLGAGHVRPCLAVDVGWLAGGTAALLVLVPRFGVVGAAYAHLALLVPLACAYVLLAARRIGVAPAALWRALRLPVVAVAVQALITVGEMAMMRWAGAPGSVAAAGGAITGAVALLLMLSAAESPPHKELLELARAVRASRAALTVPAAAEVPAPPAAATAPAPPAATVPAPANTGVTVPAPPPAATAAPARPRPSARLSAADLRDRLAPHAAMAALIVAAALCGAVAAREPRMAAGAIALGAAVLLAHRAPVSHLLALIALTAVVPLEIQARFGSGGSVDAAGILPSDLLLLTGLARALFVLPRVPLGRLSSAAVALTAVVLAASAAQLLHALALGRPVSGAGGEFRALLGFGTLFVALPILADAAQRRRLLVGLTWLGLALGIWGCAQFALHLRFADADVTIDPGSFETAGRVVGLFAFPAAATLALAALTGGVARSSGARALLCAVAATNVLAVVLTFERTFILVTLVGVALVFLRGTPRQRFRLALAAPGVAVTTVLCLGALAPAALSAYGQRLETLTQVSADPAIQYRVDESRMVESEIRSRPVVGSGLGATILIGRPGTNTPPVPRRHAENGYLWLAWKLGIPVAIAMCLLLAAAVAAPRSRWDDRSALAVRRGFQAALAGIAVASVSFPSFNQTGITAVMGLLAAACLAAELTILPIRGRAAAWPR